MNARFEAVRSETARAGTGPGCCQNVPSNSVLLKVRLILRNSRFQEGQKQDGLRAYWRPSRMHHISDVCGMSLRKSKRRAGYRVDGRSQSPNRGLFDLVQLPFSYDVSPAKNLVLEFLSDVEISL